VLRSSGEEGNDRTDAACLDPRPPVHRLDPGFGDRRPEAATGQNGWPGSIVEFLKLIGPLTDPVPFGGDAADSFDVVVPSLPGFGFSQKPTQTGWTVSRIASAWVELMKRLGYPRWAAQGGDWGAVVTTALDMLDAISLYWFTNSAASSGRIYWENRSLTLRRRHAK
jgi:pimeloyl-ACP methyl ester carboxylesterase